MSSVEYLFQPIVLLHAIGSAIGMILSYVCNAVHCGAQGQCRGESITVVFLGGHFLFTSSDTFAVGCII